MNPDFINATVGGILIAISVIIMMGMLGKVTGISGILFRGVLPNTEGRAWRAAFLAGLVIGPLLVHTLINWEFPVAPDSNIALIIASGLLVGFGTNLGSGCTSGHGVCGIGRLSTRSIVATITFMATGILTVAIVNAL